MHMFNLHSSNFENSHVVEDTPPSSELSDARSPESDQLEVIVEKPVKKAKDGNLIVSGAWVPIATTDKNINKKTIKKTKKQEQAKEGTYQNGRDLSYEQQRQRNQLEIADPGGEGTVRATTSQSPFPERRREEDVEPPSSRPRSGSVPRQLQGHVDGVGIDEIHAGSTPSRAVTNRILREFLASRESRAREQSSRPDDPSSDERNSSPGSVQSAFEPRSNRSREEERNRPPLGPLRHPVQSLVQQVQRGELKDVESSSASSYLNSTAARANSWSRRGIHPVLSLARPERFGGFRPNAPGSKEPEPYAGTEQLPGSYPQQPSASSSSSRNLGHGARATSTPAATSHTPSSGQHDVGTNEGAARTSSATIVPSSSCEQLPSRGSTGEHAPPGSRATRRIYQTCGCNLPPQQQAAQAMPPPSLPQAASQRQDSTRPARFNPYRYDRRDPQQLESRVPRAPRAPRQQNTAPPHRPNPHRRDSNGSQNRRNTVDPTEEVMRMGTFFMDATQAVANIRRAQYRQERRNNQRNNQGNNQRNRNN
ncbi:hypothetical protein Pst134EA_020969 [Puccinia striiformis f. sp. tritici]|uniref:hypothetical protein n=1 Tax=Puccinia striiformis f. sp. tritici TaxID=168172 RepID=UPI0020081ADB|nr:hypothetical protein Pst134EA_020969 [Puccinia striiformis f. sp. tritici]KAH9457070.1 hypothetical protein Pst134EA_020969 [Puccinia striiformis f. sp. tritici]